MNTSVIIPVWNGARFLPACLDALLAQELAGPAQSLEIIAVDNASPDDAAALIAQRYPQVHLLRNGQNEGFAGGCNRGIAAAQGDLIVLLNQDTQVQPGWAIALAQAASDSASGVVGCKILYPDGKTLQHAGGWVDWPLGLSHHYGHGEPDRGQYDAARTVPFVTGAALAVRREVLDRVGLLDEGFWPGYFEDNDFCQRVQAAGYRVYYTPKAVVWHQESSSWRDARAISAAYQRGRLRFLLKQLSPSRFLAEFVPAEKEYQPAAIRGQESAALQTAYASTLITAPSLLAAQWQADAATIHQVVQALRELYRQAGVEEEQKQREAATNAQLSWPSGETSAPQLTEFAFHSDLPGLGAVLTRLRTLWYNVAARWGIRHLRQQQMAINEQQAQQIQALRQQLDAVTLQNALLAEQLVALQRKIEPDE